MRSLKITSLFIYLQSSKDAVHCTKYYYEVEIQENMYHKSIVKEKKKIIIISGYPLPEPVSHIPVKPDLP